MSNSLSIFSSDTILNLLPLSISEKLIQLGSIDYYEIILPWIVCLIIVVSGMYALRFSKNKLFRLGIYSVLFYACLRLFLFDNPLSWLVYRQVLTWQEIGFREKAIIEQNLRKFIVPPSDLKFLALGSSQTGAIFSNYAKNNHNFYKIEYPGMGPLDYYLHSDTVANIKPETLILFLSEFDFAREQVTETMIYAQPQSFDRHYFLFNALKGKIGEGKAFHLSLKMLIADILPEYKFRFIFKGLRDKVLSKHYLVKTKESVFLNKSKKNITEEQTKRLRTGLSLSPLPVGLNFYLFEAFLKELKKLNTKLVVIEGQYHPDAYSSTNKMLNKSVSEKLDKLSKEYKFKYITRSMYSQLSSTDYADAFHPNSKGAKKIIDSLRHHLPSLN